MLYSIGYQGIDFNELIGALKQYGITHLIDVRSRPYSRDSRFNKNNILKMMEEYGIEYLWKGDSLGGYSVIADESLEWLNTFQANKTACLLCMESDPRGCHRYNIIGKQLGKIGVKIAHICHMREHVSGGGIRRWLTGADRSDELPERHLSEQGDQACGRYVALLPRKKGFMS